VVVRRRDGGEEWRWLELSAKVKQSARELEREREMLSGGQGWSSPFYKGRGGGCQGGNGMHLMAPTIVGRERVKEGY
jgi:hypothetical protein